MNTLHTFIILVGCLGLLLAGCKETTVVNELPGAGLTITSINPELGGPGMTVEIVGSGFSTTAAENIVTFDGIAANVEAASPTRIITVVPEGVATGPVNVRVGDAIAVGPVFTLDDRLAFVGEYIAQDYEIKITTFENQHEIITDSTLVVQTISEVNIDLFEDDPYSIEVDIEEIFEDAFNEFFLLGFNRELITVFIDRPIASVRGDEFKIYPLNFEMDIGQIRMSGKFSGSGRLIDGDTVLLEFESSAYFEYSAYNIITFLIEGEAMLEKQ